MKSKPTNLNPAFSTTADLENVTPLAEIKSKLFGNLNDGDDDDDDDVDTDLSNIRDKFLFSDEEFSTVNNKGKKKRIWRRVTTTKKFYYIFRLTK